jgi:NAD(P)-dependent dehydrogenase (short-subunit alcohol dehydrogenase family)
MDRQRIVVITGASTGIGFGLCEKYLKEGWTVFGSVRKMEDAEQFDMHENFTPLLFDVTQEKDIAHAVKTVAATSTEGIDLLINNAGIAVGGPLVHVPIDDMRHQFEVNVFGLLAVTQQFYPLLKGMGKKKPGRILQISSVSGKLGMPFIGPYSSSKFAVEGLSESLRRELMLDGIRTIVIGPGAVKTPIWDKSVAPVAEKYGNTQYAKAIERINNFFIKASIKSGLSVEFLAAKIYDISTHSNPKVRYTFISRKFTNYLMPRLLPAKMVDRLLTKRLFG